MAKSVRKIVLGGVAAAALVGGGYGGWLWWIEGRFLQSTDNAYVQSDISVVSPRVAGYVRDVRVAENQQVRGGDVLVVLEDRDYAAKAAEAEAAVDAQKAALASAQSKLVLQHSLIEQAGAQVAAAEAERLRASKEFERVKSLRGNNFASRQSFDEADAALRKAEARIAEAKATRAARLDETGVLQAALHEVEAHLAQAQAQHQAARVDLDNTVIRAPVDGVVGNRGVQVGQYARAGQQLLAIVPLPDVYVVANFKETQLAHMRPGQPVELKIDAFPGVPLKGVVESFSPASGSQFSLLPPENATGNFTKIVQRVPVRIAVPADSPLKGLLRPGLS
ncbi:MAG TPA: HlyD family secretion protein, partial [Azospirillaceae bacterium]|nr:HlyD family secretion protein [Azospirillaceae bacterium]